MKNVSEFDISEYLNDDESIAAYLTEILEDGDMDLLYSAIGDIAKAQGMSRIASESGLGRESLYKSLNSGAKPRFDTVIKVLNVLGVNLAFTPKKRTIKNKMPKVKSSVASGEKRIKEKI